MALRDLPRVPAVAAPPLTGSGTVLIWVRWTIGTSGAVASARTNVPGVTVTKETADGTYTVAIPEAKDLGGEHVTIIEDTPLTRVSLKSVANDALVVHCYAGAFDDPDYVEGLANPVSGNQISVSCWGEF